MNMLSISRKSSVSLCCDLIDLRLGLKRSLDVRSILLFNA